jgi:two-component system sensor histidine kinase ChvG
MTMVLEGELDRTDVQDVLDMVARLTDHGTVEVVVWGSENRVLLAVTDDGPGVPPAEREKVFERFHSVRPASEAFGAHSGLGLAIARTIAEAHEGSLTITDRPGGEPGAQLVLQLPMGGEDEE